MDWKKASRSGSAGGNCVELRQDLCAIRDSKNYSSGILSLNLKSLVNWVK